MISPDTPPGTLVYFCDGAGVESAVVVRVAPTGWVLMEADYLRSINLPAEQVFIDANDAIRYAAELIVQEGAAS